MSYFGLFMFAFTLSAGIYCIVQLIDASYHPGDRPFWDKMCVYFGLIDDDNEKEL